MSQPLTKSKPTQASIQNALDLLQYARADGDKLKIELCESALNDLLDRYSYHTCHKSQREGVS